jgi:hypothetical protein
MGATRLLKRQVRTIAGASLTTTPQAVGALVTIAAYKISIVNGSSSDLQISDGTANDAFYLPASSTLSIGEGLASGSQQLDKQASVPAQVQYNAFLPSGVSAGTGTVVITVEGY